MECNCNIYIYHTLYIYTYHTSYIYTHIEIAVDDFSLLFWYLSLTLSSMGMFINDIRWHPATTCQDYIHTRRVSKIGQMMIIHFCWRPYSCKNRSILQEFRGTQTYGRFTVVLLWTIYTGTRTTRTRPQLWLSWFITHKTIVTIGILYTTVRTNRTLPWAEGWVTLKDLP